jgi:hypothetical protein
MNIPPLVLSRKIILAVACLFFIASYQQVLGQSALEKSRAQTDSLQLVNDELRYAYFRKDSLYKAEKFVTADLRDQILKLQEIKTKVEKNNESFVDENLKLNQSNRILIVFNALVAVLLIISLVFFLKKINRKKTEMNDTDDVSINSEPLANTKFASLEDRLIQLERLGKLREKGFLSEAEFITEKQKVLGK